MKTLIKENKYYKLYTNTSKNRIYFDITGRISNLAAIPYFVEDWKEAVSQVDNNFTVLSDVRTMGIQTKEMEKLQEKVQSFLTENGLVEVAEVMATNDIADLQSSHIVERSGMPSTKFKSLEKAEKYLDQVVANLKKPKSKENRTIISFAENKDNRRSDFR